MEILESVAKVQYVQHHRKSVWITYGASREARCIAESSMLIAILNLQNTSSDHSLHADSDSRILSSPSPYSRR